MNPDHLTAFETPRGSTARQGGQATPLESNASDHAVVCLTMSGGSSEGGLGREIVLALADDGLDGPQPVNHPTARAPLTPALEPNSEPTRMRSAASRSDFVPAVGSSTGRKGRPGSRDPRKPLRGSGTDDADCVWIRDTDGLDGLVNDVLSERRWYPIVGLTTRPRELRPSLDPARVRGIVGKTVPIYVIATAMTRPLERMLPKGLRVFGGAVRLWWPIPRLDPDSHPLIYDPSGQYGEASLRELQSQFASTRVPTRRSEVLLEARLTDAEDRVQQLSEDLNTVILQCNRLLRERAAVRRGQRDMQI